MSTFVLLSITGLGLGAMYFLVASGLSLIYGLMGVLNFAHGAFITVGAYASWWTSTHVFDGIGSLLLRFLLSALLGLVIGALFAALVELIGSVHREEGKTVLMVEHHMDVVTGLAERIAVMHHGALLACDTPAAVMANETVQSAYLGEEL